MPHISLLFELSFTYTHFWQIFEVNHVYILWALALEFAGRPNWEFLCVQHHRKGFVIPTINCSENLTENGLKMEKNHAQYTALCSWLQLTTTYLGKGDKIGIIECPWFGNFCLPLGISSPWHLGPFGSTHPTSGTGWSKKNCEFWKVEPLSLR